MTSQKKELINNLNQILETAKHNLSQLSLVEYNLKTEIYSWSKKEILGHLIDSALNNHRRFMLSKKQDHLVFEGYKQEDWVSSHDYQSQDRENLIELWYALNKLIIQVIKSIPSRKLFITSNQHNFHSIAWQTVPSEKASTLAYLFADYIGHLEHHLGQIIPNYQKLQKPYSNSDF